MPVQASMRMMVSPYSRTAQRPPGWGRVFAKPVAEPQPQTMTQLVTSRPGRPGKCPVPSGAVIGIRERPVPLP